MKPPDEIKKDFTRLWLVKAEHDLRTAVHLSSSGMDFADSIVFHAQQAVEKYIKAYLVWEQIEFPKTHDIAALLNLVGHNRGELAQALADASDLTPYGVTHRYPGDYPQVEQNDVEKAVSVAEHVRREIRDNLPAEVQTE
ncbi:MAG: HEPN domain-containing protein [Planctomycetes bacterium]|nr:HEPN domain-containing protein [Planctomycetota bacterium]